MSKQKIEDFLTKQLFISKNVVTYRLLSRELGIHVNVAKNELAAFYTKLTKSPDQACSATYLISGEHMFPFSCNANTGSRSKKKANGCLLDMDIDSDSSPYDFTPTQSQSQSQPPLKPHFKEYGNVEGGKKGNKDVVVQIRLTVVGEAELGGRYVYLSAFVFV
ncbi:CDC27 protein [Leucoagaricus gongylophorus]